MEIGAEKTGIVEALFAQGFPGFLVEDFGIRFQPPDHIQLLALGIVIQAGRRYLRQPGITLNGFHRFDHVGSSAKTNDLASIGKGHAAVPLVGSFCV